MVFVRERLGYYENPAILTDTVTKAGGNAPDFVDHRHDQSVLSVLKAPS